MFRTMFGSKGTPNGPFILLVFAILIVPAFLFWFSPAGWQALLNSGPGENCGENGIEEGCHRIAGLPEEPLSTGGCGCCGGYHDHKTQFMAPITRRMAVLIWAKFEVITPYLQQADLIVGNLRPLLEERRGAIALTPVLTVQTRPPKRCGGRGLIFYALSITTAWIAVSRVFTAPLMLLRRRG